MKENVHVSDNASITASLQNVVNTTSPHQNINDVQTEKSIPVQTTDSEIQISSESEPLQVTDNNVSTPEEVVQDRT